MTTTTTTTHAEGPSLSEALQAVADLILCPAPGDATSPRTCTPAGHVDATAERHRTAEASGAPLVRCVVARDVRGGLAIVPPVEESFFDDSDDEALRPRVVRRRVDEVRAFRDAVARRHPHPSLRALVLDASGSSTSGDGGDDATAAACAAYLSTCLSLGDPWTAAARAFLGRVDDDVLDASTLVQRRPSRHEDLRVVPATTLAHYLWSMYAPCAACALAYAGLLTKLGALEPRDWANGGCAVAVLTTPLVLTLLLALALPDDALHDDHRATSR